MMILQQTATPTPGQTLTSPKLVMAKSAFGGQLGEISLSILRDVHQHPDDTHPERVKRLSGGINLSSRVNTLVCGGYLLRVTEDGKTLPLRLKLTGKGGRAIGVQVHEDPPAPKPTRICNASMPNTTDMGRYTGMGRIGLAMCGVSGR